MSVVLVLNAGSSSLKYALFGPGQPPGHRERGASASDADLRHQLDAVVERVNAGGETLEAVGHRVVHGGPKHVRPERVTAALLDDLRAISPFDPQHLPAQISIMQHLLARFPQVPQIACFDTAFHADLPRVSRVLPIPRKYEAQGIRRYGFHGLSYAYLVEELRRLGALPSRVVLAHLGSGCSLAAVKDGRSVDTTMAFTPSAGIPMSRRSGDLDPGLAAFLAHSEGMTPDQFQEMTSSRSGLLGISETSADVRDLLKAEADDPRAAEALEIFCYTVRKTVGAYAAALGGLDALVFSGGIGERSPVLRERICRGLEFLDVRLDPARNAANEPVISGGRAAVRVIRTDEEAQIAGAVREILNP